MRGEEEWEYGGHVLRAAARVDESDHHALVHGEGQVVATVGKEERGEQP